MMIGDPSTFAIESGITRSYGELNVRALGYFLIHVCGHRYGVDRPDATMLACSLGQVKKRIADRGRHTAPFATELDAGKIADSFRSAIYAEQQDERVFGIPLADFTKLFDRNLNDLMWAPDGDEAFDDSSYVLQFDVEDRVRLIAFRSGNNYHHDPTTLGDLWLAADDFYRVLQRWRDAFESEWVSMPKAPYYLDGWRDPGSP